MFREEARHAVRGKAATMGSRIADLAQARASAPGEAPAYAEGRTGARLTWREVAVAVTEWTERARDAGMPPGAPVVLLAERPLAFIGAYLGLLAAGAVVLPLAPATAGSLAEAAAGIDEFAAVAVVTDSDAGHAAAEHAGVVAWGVAAGGAPLHLAAPPAGSRRLAPAAWAEPSSVMLRTSGSTGRPKGVPLQDRQLLHNARAVVHHHRLGPGERLYSSLPLVHINAEVVGVLAALVAGSTLVVDDRFRRAGFWAVLDEWEVTVLNAVPAILTILSEEAAPPRHVAERIRFARSASAPLPAATLVAFEQRCGIGVLETYGMTEAAGQICANPLDPGERRPTSVGHPVDIELQVVDGDGNPVDPGVPGDVQIRGPSVTTGYVVPAGGPDGDPRPQAPRDRSAWLTTGDVGFQDPGGYLFLMGRTDGVINRGGEKVYPREVEEVLRRHPGVRQAVVVGEPDPVLGERPVAIVVRRDPGGPDGVHGAGGRAFEVALLDLCRRELSRHKQPVRIQLAEKLPETPTGKIRRDQLKALLSPAGALLGAAEAR
jgi:acyl-CoA synthetase (AMP-forming)/AMP-acid ligase II